MYGRHSFAMTSFSSQTGSKAVDLASAAVAVNANGGGGGYGLKNDNGDHLITCWPSLSNLKRTRVQFAPSNFLR